MFKEPANAVFLHRPIIGFDLRADPMLAGAQRDDFRQATLRGVSGNQAKSLLCGPSNSARIDEVVIHPDCDLGIVKAVLQLQAQAGILHR